MFGGKVGGVSIYVCLLAGVHEPLQCSICNYSARLPRYQKRMVTFQPAMHRRIGAMVKFHVLVCKAVWSTLRMDMVGEQFVKREQFHRLVYEVSMFRPFAFPLPFRTCWMSLSSPGPHNNGRQKQSKLWEATVKQTNSRLERVFQVRQEPARKSDICLTHSWLWPRAKVC